MTPCKFKVGDRVVSKYPTTGGCYGPVTVNSLEYSSREGWKVWALFRPERGEDTWSPEEYCSLVDNGLETMLKVAFDD